jgi:hypothetical protein
VSGYRYEIEPRPESLDGGFRVYLFGFDPETGNEIGLGGVFRIEPDVDENKLMQALWRRLNYG